jgi:hypothetical protein
MATVFVRHQAGTGNGLCNVLGSKGKEVVVAGDDQRRHVQALELGMQVVALGETNVSFISRSSTALDLRTPSSPVR